MRVIVPPLLFHVNLVGDEADDHKVFDKMLDIMVNEDEFICNTGEWTQLIHKGGIIVKKSNSTTPQI